MSDQLLQLLLTYGPAVLIPVVAVASVGLPLPTSIMLLGAGAFAGGGQVSFLALVISAVIGAVAGDNAGYWIGRRGGATAVERWGARLKVAPGVIERVERRFVRWGSLTILLTRFLLTPFGPLVNIVAGTSRYAFRYFLLWDFVGELIWVAVYVGLGYVFSANWDLLANFLGSATTLLTVATVTAIVAALVYHTVARDWLRAREDSGVDLPAR